MTIWHIAITQYMLSLIMFAHVQPSTPTSLIFYQ